eukprot:1160260-Pelagomonas_calceolata.AAC.1
MVPEKGAKEFKDDSSDDAPKQAEKVSEAVPSADIEHQGPPCAQDHGHKHGTICVHGHGKGKPHLPLSVSAKATGPESLLSGLLLISLYGVTAPVGIAIGIGIAEGYDSQSTAALATQGMMGGADKSNNL